MVFPPPPAIPLPSAAIPAVSGIPGSGSVVATPQQTEMALYAEAGGHVAKRPRVDFHQTTAFHHHQPAAALHLTTAGGMTAAAALGMPANAAAAAAVLGGNGILSQHYIEQQLNRKPAEPEKPNHILLFTVLNPTYPITCEVLNTICSPLGSVLRIVIFKKNGVQAMVEFDNVDTAKAAKESLHGCDIYSGCCTLKIEFAKPTKLNVYKNDNDSWDYTNPNLGKNPAEPAVSSAPVSQRPVLLKEPLARTSTSPTSVGSSQSASSPTAQAAAAQAAANAAATAIPSTTLINGANGISIVNTNPMLAGIPPETYENGFVSAHHSPPQMTTPNSTLTCSSLDVLAGQRVLAAGGASAAILRGAGLTAATAAAAGTTVANPGSSPTNSNGATTPGSYTHHQGAVCMVYGLTLEKMNANRIFNLFCLYGNVVRVKFLKTKEGCAMVQMGDSLAVERVVSNLNNNSFFESKMQLGFSKQAFLADVQSPYQLPDGSLSFQDFMGSKNNRFINPEMASKNRIQPPSKILHFFNTPPGLEAEDIEAIFVKNGSPKPKCVKMFPSKTERSSSGLIEFETLAEALEGLVICNHHPVPNSSSKFPYIMKLCFSSSRSIPTTIR